MQPVFLPSYRPALLNFIDSIIDVAKSCAEVRAPTIASDSHYRSLSSQSSVSGWSRTPSPQLPAPHDYQAIRYTSQHMLGPLREGSALVHGVAFVT